jgi:hypothetical protein
VDRTGNSGRKEKKTIANSFTSRLSRPTLVFQGLEVLADVRLHLLPLVLHDKSRMSERNNTPKKTAFIVKSLKEFEILPLTKTKTHISSHAYAYGLFQRTNDKRLEHFLQWLVIIIIQVTPVFRKPERANGTEIESLVEKTRSTESVDHAIDKIR